MYVEYKESDAINHKLWHSSKYTSQAIDNILHGLADLSGSVFEFEQLSS